MKIGAVEQIRDLVNLQLPGIPLRALPVAPPELPFLHNAVYFELDQSVELWRALARSAAFAMHLSGEILSFTLSSGLSGRGRQESRLGSWRRRADRRRQAADRPGGHAVGAAQASEATWSVGLSGAPGFDLGRPRRPGTRSRRTTRRPPRAGAGRGRAGGAGGLAGRRRGAAVDGVRAPARGRREADVEALRREIAEQLRVYETRAARFGRPGDVSAGRYALAAFIDEAVMTTRWGSASAWSVNSLLREFHSETWGGEKVFAIVDRVRAQPVKYLALLKLLDACLALEQLQQREILDRLGADAVDDREHLLPPRTPNGIRAAGR